MNLSEYIIKKIEKLGVEHIFGCIENENSFILNSNRTIGGLNFINTLSEINTGYAANGYGLGGKYGVIITKFKTNEFATLNAIKISANKNVPLMILIEAPDYKTLKNLPEFDMYLKTYQNFIDFTSVLNRDNAKIEIDRLFKEFIQNKNSIYIIIPKDIAGLEISYKESDFEYNTNDEIFEIFPSKDTRENIPNLINDTSDSKILSINNFITSIQKILNKNDVILINSKAEEQIKEQLVSFCNFQVFNENANGWGIPALLGASLSNKEKRVILIIDNKSYISSALEISNIVKLGLKPFVIILNLNNEDLLIDHARFSRIFNGEIWATKVDKPDDLEKAFRVVQIINKLCILEIILTDIFVAKNANNFIESMDEKSITQINTIENNKKESSYPDDIIKDSVLLNKEISYTTNVHASIKELE